MIILQKPNELNFSKNPVSFQLYTGNYQVQKGKKARLKLAYTDFGAPHINRFVIHNQSVFFYCSPPSFITYDEEFELPKFDDQTQSWKDYNDDIADLYRSNFFVNTYFNIYRESTDKEYIIIEAKEFDTDFTGGGNFYNASRDNSLDFQEYESSVPYIYSDKLKVVAQIINQDSLETITEIAQYVNTKGEVEFDFNKYLNAEFKIIPRAKEYPIEEGVDFTAYPIPDVGNKSMKKIAIYFIEKYGATTPTGKMLKSESFFVLQGGIEKRYFHKIEAFNDRFLTGEASFLTNQPREKEICRDQPEWVDLIFNKEQAHYLNKFVSVYSVAEVTYNDDSTETIYSNNGVVIETKSNKYTHLSIPVGFKHFNLQNKETDKKVISYSVKVQSLVSGIKTTISETLNFILADSTRESKVLIFKNNYGAFDTIHTQAYQRSIDKIKSKELLNAEVNFIDSGQADAKKHIESYYREYMLSMGNLTNEEKEWASEILTSEEVYLYTENKLIPIIISNQKENGPNELETITPLVLSYRFAHLDFSHSNI